MSGRWIALLLTVAAGCSEQVDKRYGVVYGKSVNGIGSFLSLLREDGRRADVSLSLNPRLFEDAEALIIFERGFDRLDNETLKWLDDWLYAGRGRNLVLVLRDMDEEIALWENVLEGFDALESGYREKVEARLEDARSRLLQQTADDVGTADPWYEREAWYSLDADAAPAIRRADSVTIADAWPEAPNLEQGKLDLRFRRRLAPLDRGERLVTAGDDVLIARIRVKDSNLWLVANGSFLLNYGLVNREHRKLALALAGSLGDGARVTLVTSATVTEGEADRGPFAVLAVTPINWIAPHVLALALVFALYRFPIFGRPTEKVTREAYHFGRHVEALGLMLSESRDLDYARERIKTYHQHARG
jgi:hypothetical protein